MKLKLSFLFIILLFIIACGGNSNRDSSKELNIHLLSDPDKLQPASSNDATASFIERFLFQKLIDWDYEKADFVGVIAESRPVITEITSGPYKGGLKLDYVIRPEAKWDNGDPITVHDVIFSYKAILNPKTNCEQLRPYLDFIADIQYDSTDLRKFSVISNKKYILVEEYSGYWVFPEYLNDPDKLMRQFTFKELNDPVKSEELKGNEDILKFADNFNDQKYAREKDYVVGSGAYKLEKWETGQKIILRKKDSWWGNTTNSSLMQNYGNIKTLHFKIINDWTTTNTAIKGGDIDVANSVEYKIYNELISDDDTKNKFNFSTPEADVYYYLGLNNSHPILKNRNVREALAHAINVNELISTLLYGLATPIQSFVLPTKSYYKKDIKPYEFSLLKAAEMLDAEGWKDTDGDGIRDNVIDGKKIKLSLQYKYNSGNDTRKNIGLIFKENLKKIGVELTIVSKEWTVFHDDVKRHDFEIYAGAWVGDPNVEDPMQIWHTESSGGGSNYVSYGDNYTDNLINQIRTELDVKKRDAMYYTLQQKIHDDVPYIFLYTPLERIVIDKKVQNAKTYNVRPGFDLGLWKIESKKQD